MNGEQPRFLETDLRVADPTVSSLSACQLAEERRNAGNGSGALHLQSSWESMSGCLQESTTESCLLLVPRGTHFFRDYPLFNVSSGRSFLYTHMKKKVLCLHRLGERQLGEIPGSFWVRSLFKEESFTSKRVKQEDLGEFMIGKWYRTPHYDVMTEF